MTERPKQNPEYNKEKVFQSFLSDLQEAYTQADSMEQCAACIFKCLQEDRRCQKTKRAGRYPGDFVYLSAFMEIWRDYGAGKYSEENGDQMKRVKWIIFGISIALMAGCSGKKAAEVSADEKNVESTEEEQNVLDFVDAHGERYTVEINEAVEKNPYDNELFVKDDNHKISYEDKKYISRLGVDVSVFQGDIDWEQVKAAGYEFAILRIGYRGYGEEGTLNADEKFEQNLENARKAEMDVGVYFFSQAVNEEEAKEEADFVLEHLRGQELQMPVVYDPEHILEDEARTDDVAGEQFTDNAETFCKAVEEAGYDAMIYSNMLWEAYELDLEKLSDYPIWYADYEALPQTPYRFCMWQYSSTGSVPGIEGNVDLNIQLLKK